MNTTLCKIYNNYLGLQEPLLNSKVYNAANEVLCLFSLKQLGVLHNIHITKKVGRNVTSLKQL